MPWKLYLKGDYENLLSHVDVTRIKQLYLIGSFNLNNLEVVSGNLFSLSELTIRTDTSLENLPIKKFLPSHSLEFLKIDA